ncbi:MAG: PKD domain-containing protein [Candidatus Bipolaricaulia bacterium]
MKQTRTKIWILSVVGISVLLVIAGCASLLIRNRAPIAVAVGPNRTVTVGAMVTLDGTSSGDPDTEFLDYQWIMVEKPSDSQAGIINANSSTPQFIPDIPGRYVVELRVTDSGGLGDRSQVVIIAETGS